MTHGKVHSVIFCMANKPLLCAIYWAHHKHLCHALKLTHDKHFRNSLKIASHQNWCTTNILERKKEMSSGPLLLRPVLSSTPSIAAAAAIRPATGVQPLPPHPVLPPSLMPPPLRQCHPHHRNKVTRAATTTTRRRLHKEIVWEGWRGFGHTTGDDEVAATPPGTTTPLGIMRTPDVGILRRLHAQLGKRWAALDLRGRRLRWVGRMPLGSTSRRQAPPWCSANLLDLLPAAESSDCCRRWRSSQRGSVGAGKKRTRGHWICVWLLLRLPWCRRWVPVHGPAPSAQGARGGEGDTSCSPPSTVAPCLSSFPGGGDGQRGGREEGGDSVMEREEANRGEGWWGWVL